MATIPGCAPFERKGNLTAEFLVCVFSDQVQALLGAIVTAKSGRGRYAGPRHT